MGTDSYCQLQPGLQHPSDIRWRCRLLSGSFCWKCLYSSLTEPDLSPSFVTSDPLDNSSEVYLLMPDSRLYRYAGNPCPHCMKGQILPSQESCMQCGWTPTREPTEDELIKDGRKRREPLSGRKLRSFTA